MANYIVYDIGGSSVKWSIMGNVSMGMMQIN